MRPTLHEKGSALVYILIAIALLAALTFTFMEPSSQQSSSQSSFKTVTGLDTQIHLIRSSIQQCILTHPKGDPAITDADANTIYPIDPNSTYYSGATPGQSGDRYVRNIRCPGNNVTGNAEDHVKIFSGTTGRFLPPPPPLFSEWQYYNGQAGVFFWIESEKSDFYIQSALEKLDEKYSECEADVIDASSSAQELTEFAPIECASGSICFRVWMITTGDSAYEGDSDNDEASCP
jgi:hypothetical protein